MGLRLVIHEEVLEQSADGGDLVLAEGRGEDDIVVEVTTADRDRAKEDGGEGGLHPSNVIEYGYPTGTLNWTGDR